MQSNVDENIIRKLLVKSHNDDVEKIVVGAVIFYKDDEVLLLERVSGDFMGGLVELPSGGVDNGENLITALAREVAEETGLTIARIVSYVDSFDYLSSSGKKTRQFNFLVDVTPGEVQCNPAEHCAYHLVAPKDDLFTTLNISDANKKTIETAQQQR